VSLYVQELLLISVLNGGLIVCRVCRVINSIKVGFIINCTVDSIDF